MYLERNPEGPNRASLILFNIETQSKQVIMSPDDSSVDGKELYNAVVRLASDSHAYYSIGRDRLCCAAFKDGLVTRMYEFEDKQADQYNAYLPNALPLQGFFLKQREIVFVS